jgi:hypothetical protein
MRSVLRVSTFVVALSTFAVGCVAPPDSPWEITVQLERRVDLFGGVASVAVRADDIEDPAVLVNVQCEGTDRTVRIPKLQQSQEICGLTFELSNLAVRSGDAVAATLVVRWDDEESE